MNGELFPATQHDPGGRLLPLPPDAEGWAVFGGPADCYRYRLGRRWDPGRPFVLFVGMNLSTANLRFDDPTVAKLGRMARQWGYGGLLVGNVHAYRCTDQARLAETDDPCGPENDAHLLAMVAEATLIVMAYGTPKIPKLQKRGPQVARMLAEAGHMLHALRLSKDGVPVHPLYLPDRTEPALWIQP
jgi:hypothetical protein